MYTYAVVKAPMCSCSSLHAVAFPSFLDPADPGFVSINTAGSFSFNGIPVINLEAKAGATRTCFMYSRPSLSLSPFPVF